MSFFPAGCQRIALQSCAVERLRGFPSNDISDVALLKRLRSSEAWLRSLCIELLRENGGDRVEKAACTPIRIVDGTIVKEAGKTGSQWRILYSLQLPSFTCDFFDVTAVFGEGSGESLHSLAVVPNDLIIAHAGTAQSRGLNTSGNGAADVLVRVNPQGFVPYSPNGRRIKLRS